MLARPQDYPPLYVLRPDGSTLYTYRDVVYRSVHSLLAHTRAACNLALKRADVRLRLLVAASRRPPLRTWS
jgi:hypothetical protein